MLRLIKMELKKVLYKKSIYVIVFLTLSFCILNNVLYYLDYDKEGFYRYSLSDDLNLEKDKLVKELSKYDIHKESDISMYLSIKSQIDILELKKKFSKNTWQYKLLHDYLYDLIYQKNMYTYVLDDKATLEEIKNKYEEQVQRFFHDDWKYFVKLEIDKEKGVISHLNLLLDDADDILSQREVQKQLVDERLKLKILEYRIKNNVKDENNYLNVTLNSYQENYRILNDLKDKKTNLSRDEKLIYQDTLSNLMVNEYILKYKQNINKENSVNYLLRTISEDYEVFLVLLILIVSSTIICEEFQKGTIKLLLIKPYSRGKILLSKFFTCCIVLVICIMILILVQLLLGIFLFGASSLKIPVIVYHLSKRRVISYSIWHYMLIRIMVRFPFFIMLLVISFTLSVFFTSTVLSISIPMFLYIFDSTIRNLEIQYHLKWIRYMINTNWHFEDYLFGNISKNTNINLEFSVIIWMGYFVVLTSITVWYFKRKNIKNI